METSTFNAGPAANRISSGPVELTATKIREMMANAQKTIAERKVQLGLGETHTANGLSFPPGAIPDAETFDKMRRAAQLQAQIAARLNSGILSSYISSETDSRKSKEVPNVIFDEEGKTIDATTGEEIQLTHYTPTLKANLRARRAQQFKEVLQTNAQKKPQKNLTASPYFDPRLSLKAARRPRKQLTFYEPGKFIQLAQRIRTKYQLQQLQESVAQAVKRTGIASAAKLSTIQPKRAVDETEVPELEWWDVYILRNGVTSYSALNDAAEHGLPTSAVVNKAWITNLVEHPVKLKAPKELSKRPEIPLLLTKKERKKLRRQNRQEAQKERQEKVRLGLMPPPEPKYYHYCFDVQVRLANLMRVLGSDAVQDPSKVEAYVRAQMESRKRAHEASNAARKLTKEQARYKRIKKIKEDTSTIVYVAVYRVNDFSNPSHRFKVETNANQLLMTGLVALHPDCNVVVVEGGQRQQRKFERLMLHRIKWHEGKRGASNLREDATQGSGSTEPGCRLVWKLKKSTSVISLIKDSTFKLKPLSLPIKSDSKCENVSKFKQRKTEVVGSDRNLLTANSAIDNVPSKPTSSRRHIGFSNVVNHREALATGLTSSLQTISNEPSQPDCQQDKLSVEEDAIETLDELPAEGKTKGTSLEKFIETTISQLEGKSVQQIYEAHFSSTASASAEMDTGQRCTQGHLSSTKPSTCKSFSRVTPETDNIPHAAKSSASSVQCSEDSTISAVNIDVLVDAVLQNFQTMSLEDLFKYYFGAPTVENPSELRTRICEDSCKRTYKRRATKRITNPDQTTPVETCEMLCNGKPVEENAVARKHSCSEVEEMTESLLLPSEEERHLKPSIDRGCIQSQNELSASHCTPSVEISQDVPGTWVECVLCNKWRFLNEVTDPSVLDDAWHCGLQSRYSEGMENVGNPCDEPQAELNYDEVENRKYVFTKFTAGSLIWVKLDGYPEWPAMVDCDATGRYADYDQSTGEVFRYFVVFFDPKHVTRQCVRVTRIRKFTSASDVDLNRILSFSQSNRYRKRLELAIAEAEKALDLPLQKKKRSSGSKVIRTGNGAVKVILEAGAVETKATITTARPEDKPPLDVTVLDVSQKANDGRLLANVDTRIKSFSKTSIRKNFKPPRMSVLKTHTEKNVSFEGFSSNSVASKQIWQKMHMSPTSMKSDNVGVQLKSTVQFVSALQLNCRDNNIALDDKISLPNDATSFGNFEDVTIAQKRSSRDDHTLSVLNLVDDLGDQRLMLHSPQQVTSGLQFDLHVDEVLQKIENLTAKELAGRYFPDLHLWLQKNEGALMNPSHLKSRKPMNEFIKASRVLKQLAHEMKRRRTMANHSTAHFYGLSNISSLCDSPKLPGTWVECSLCKKWRYLPHIHDPSQIEVDWYCGLSQDATGTPGRERMSLTRIACNRPQSPLPDVQEDDYIFTEFAVGSIVWVKLQGYPEWPAMVYYNEKGRYAEYDMNTRDVLHYHVVFLDPTRSTISRVRATKLRRFTPPLEGYLDKVQKSAVSSSLEREIFSDQNECLPLSTNINSYQSTQWESNSELRVLPNPVKSPPRRDLSTLDSVSYSPTNSPLFLQSADKTYFDWLRDVTTPTSGCNRLNLIETTSIERLHDFQDDTKTKPGSNTIQQLMRLACADLQVYSPYPVVRKSNENSASFGSVSSNETWAVHRVPFHLQLIRG
ncbi:hypothetical protein EG68_01179 [Paragonimus skrjabini miyazakii]|uniref:Uncharacterized protein n=1 Tax=Paragonimus skrjabini miyazakii TaxID=59628 RepID=A0A8S9Z221_9TREM|nr:hypothetical protein EG68_01179 [Paragonimus skrjabini miyazakii]